jgi:hypothetical protein
MAWDFAGRHAEPVITESSVYRFIPRDFVGLTKVSTNSFWLSPQNPLTTQRPPTGTVTMAQERRKRGWGPSTSSCWSWVGKRF